MLGRTTFTTSLFLWKMKEQTPQANKSVGTSVNSGQPPNLAGKDERWLWQRQTQGPDAGLGPAGSRGQRVGAAPFALQAPNPPEPTLAWKDPTWLPPEFLSPSTAPVHSASSAAAGVNRPSCVEMDQGARTGQNEPKCRGRAAQGCGTKGGDTQGEENTGDGAHQDSRFSGTEATGTLVSCRDPGVMPSNPKAAWG